MQYELSAIYVQSLAWYVHNAHLLSLPCHLLMPVYAWALRRASDGSMCVVSSDA